MKCIFVLFLEQNLLKDLEWVQSKGKAIAFAQKFLSSDRVAFNIKKQKYLCITLVLQREQKKEILDISLRISQ